MGIKRSAVGLQVIDCIWYFTWEYTIEHGFQWYNAILLCVKNAHNKIKIKCLDSILDWGKKTYAEMVTFRVKLHANSYIAVFLNNQGTAKRSWGSEIELSTITYALNSTVPKVLNEFGQASLYLGTPYALLLIHYSHWHRHWSNVYLLSLTSYQTRWLMFTNTTQLFTRH